MVPKMLNGEQIGTYFNRNVPLLFPLLSIKFFRFKDQLSLFFSIYFEQRIDISSILRATFKVGYRTQITPTICKDLNKASVNNCDGLYNFFSNCDLLRPCLSLSCALQNTVQRDYLFEFARVYYLYFMVRAFSLVIEDQLFTCFVLFRWEEEVILLL